MKTETRALGEAPEKKRKLIEATVGQMLRNGYSATSVDQICAEAGVTKGSFFYYFASKEEICRTAMEAWAGAWQGILDSARLDLTSDPLDRLDRLFDVMVETYMRPDLQVGCLIGTIAQEQAVTNRVLGGSCEEHLGNWVAVVSKMLADAKIAHHPKIDFDPVSLADFMLGTVQGSMLVAKTRQDRGIILNNVRHCRAYIDSLFGRERK